MGLQKDYTTPEQSKRLLELGVPADSADCFRWDFSSAFGISEDNRYSTSITVLCFEYQRDYYDKLPCWSVGRLIEIHLKCCTTLNQSDAHIVISRFGIETGGLLQNVYDMVGECALLGRYDFSKLEEV